MKTRLIIDGNSVYEIDEECMECRKKTGSRVRVQKQESRKGEQKRAVQKETEQKKTKRARPQGDGTA